MEKVKPKVKLVKPIKPVKLPEPKIKVKSSRLIVEFDKADKADNPGKYVDKLKILVSKIKNQTMETDNRIRFGWQ